ncbi:hypothetical protein [Paraconexibacter sp. AEG42_29]|uniref:hypothetical protein n=1 Tax=Paraconexibacter sp. AEG42_29 TaxID=2997339 RepID=UPI00339D38BC
MDHDLEVLEQVLGENEFDHVGVIVGTTWLPEAERFDIVVRARPTPDTGAGQWSIACHSPIRWAITESPIVEAELLDDHPALLDIVDEQAELYFRGVAADPAALTDALRAAHDRHLGMFVAFEDQVNETAEGLRRHIAGGYGKLAGGSKAAMTLLADVLLAHGVAPNILPAGPPKRWSERQGTWVAPPASLTLLVLGDSWVIAEQFLAIAH